MAMFIFARIKLEARSWILADAKHLVLIILGE
jgi:hypothetical protein